MRIHSSLTAVREAFVLNLLMATPDLNFQGVNDALASEDHKDLWATPKDGEAKPLMMAFKRIAELRDFAKVANDHIANGQPVPPIPPSSLKKVKAVKAEIVADAPAEDTVIVTSEPAEVVTSDSPAISNDNASEATEAAAQAV